MPSDGNAASLGLIINITRDWGGCPYVVVKDISGGGGL
jgi:hypothetical protein